MILHTDLPVPPAFNEAVDTILGEAIEISNQRGGEYEDSWALENLKTSVLDNVLRMVGDRQPYTPEQKRLIVIAALVDVKISRFLGPWKKDTPVDLINYLAALTHWMEKYEANSQR